MKKEQTRNAFDKELTQPTMEIITTEITNIISFQYIFFSFVLNKTV